MNDKTTFPISIATAIAIQSICGFDPRNKDYSIALNDLFDPDNNFNT